MSLTADYISELNASLPDGATETVNVLDNYLRTLHRVLKTQFPGFVGTTAITASEDDVNTLDGAAAADGVQFKNEKGYPDGYASLDGDGYIPSTQLNPSGLFLPSAGGTMTGDLTLEQSLVETVYALSGTTPSIDPANGTIQTWTLTGNSTPTSALTTGESLTLKILDGSGYTITWSMVDEWLGGEEPVLSTTNSTWVVLFNVGGTVYGYLCGVSSAV